MPELNTCHSLGLKSGALGTRATCLHLQVRYDRKGLELEMGPISSLCHPNNLRCHPNTPKREPLRASLLFISWSVTETVGLHPIHVSPKRTELGSREIFLPLNKERHLLDTGWTQKFSVHFIRTACQIVLISLLAGSPCGREAPSLVTMSVLEKTLSKKTFSLPERVPQSLGLAPGAGSKLPSAEAGSPHRGHCANIALPSGCCCCCCRTISVDQRLGAGREKSPPIPQVPRLLLVASAFTLDSQESLP